MSIGFKPHRQDITGPTGTALRRKKAPYRKIAVAARRIIVQTGSSLTAAKIQEKLPQDLQASVGPRRLSRVLRRSKRAGLVETSGEWSVRAAWLTKPDMPRAKARLNSKLAGVRAKLKAACARAMLHLEQQKIPLTIDDLLVHLADPNVDRRLFRRAMGNRLLRIRPLVRIADNLFQWIDEEDDMICNDSLSEEKLV
jgi:hypothetical protein